MVGSRAGEAVTTGHKNICIGHDAGGAITTGAKNVVIGYDAANYEGNDLTTGENCTIIGSYNRVSASGTLQEKILGYYVMGASNSFTFGNGATDSRIDDGATSITAPSDVRLKEEIEDEKVGLDFINELRPVTFRWKKEKDVPVDLNAYGSGSEKRVMNGKYNHGFIAQEVKEVLDKNPNIKDGFDLWTEDVDGRQRIGEGSLISILVKGIQELSAKVEELESKLNN